MSEKTDEKQSRILIAFESPSSAHFNVTVENVTPMQLLALASYLDFEAKQGLLEQKIMQRRLAEQQKIIVPETKLV